MGTVRMLWDLIQGLPALVMFHSVQPPHHHLQNFLISPQRASVPIKHPPIPSSSPWPTIYFLLPGTCSSRGPVRVQSCNICIFLCVAEHVLKAHPRCSRCQDFLPFEAEEYVLVGVDRTLSDHPSVDTGWFVIFRDYEY